MNRRRQSLSGPLRAAAVAALLVLSGTARTTGPTASAAQVGPCGLSPVACENQNAGTPSSLWDVVGAGDPTIQGFATDMSVNRGGTVRFKIKTDAASYQIPIYRMGYYGGMGARLIVTLNPSA